MKRRPVTPPYSPGRSTKAAVLVGLAALATSFAGGCAAEQSADNSRNFVAGTPAATDGQASKQPAENASSPARSPTNSRKIIYDARIDLVVDSLSGTEGAILRLINEHNGFLAESDQSSLTAFQRRGTWRVRVPIDHFSAFVSAVSRLGEVRQNHVGSQDVTEEFFDLEARIRNKREEEKRLLKHLADSTGKLKDILEVEKELSRVRGEVEQMEGRLRFLANRTELSTVTIEATEWKDYKPPIAATFQTQIGRTFFGSYEALVEFGKFVLLVLVALAPWIPLFVLGLFVLRWAFRFGRRRSRSRSLFTIDPIPRASS
ncbi:MAG: DUF4349 domain-containing protein [Isosphaerales bacterium]